MAVCELSKTRYLGKRTGALFVTVSGQQVPGRAMLSKLEYLATLVVKIKRKF